jgi:hypothetical protein
MTSKCIETALLWPRGFIILAFYLASLTVPWTTLTAEAELESPPTNQSEVRSGVTHPPTPMSLDDYERFKEEVDQLYERHYERMTDFEKSRILDFYSVYYLGTQKYEKAIEILEQQLSIENLDEDTRTRSEKALADLRARVSATSF